MDEIHDFLNCPQSQQSEEEHNLLADCVHYWIVEIVDGADISAECGHVGRSHITFRDIERERDMATDGGWAGHN